MFYSGASNNVMSLKFMNRLDLKVTRPYRNVCGINSRAILLCGLIKDLKVILATYLDISLLMDFVVIDVPDAWGMLLYRKWVATLGGILQMDFSYVTILTLEGDFFTLYREPVMGYQVEDPQKPTSGITYLNEMIGSFCTITNPITLAQGLVLELSLYLLCTRTLFSLIGLSLIIQIILLSMKP